MSPYLNEDRYDFQKVTLQPMGLGVCWDSNSRVGMLAPDLAMLLATPLPAVYLRGRDNAPVQGCLSPEWETRMECWAPAFSCLATETSRCEPADAR